MALLLRRCRRRGRCRRGGARGGAALQALAQFVAALLELLLELLLLLLELLRVDRRAVEGLSETGEGHREGNFARDLVLDADVEGRALLHQIDEIVLEAAGLGEAAVREAHGVFARVRLALVDREADA